MERFHVCDCMVGACGGECSSKVSILCYMGMCLFNYAPSYMYILEVKAAFLHRSAVILEARLKQCVHVTLYRPSIRTSS